MIKKYWHFVFPLLMLALMVFIFCMSAQPADDSSLTSSRFATFAARHLLTNFREFDAGEQSKIIAGLTFIVRKGAHFSEYAMLAFLGYLCGVIAAFVILSIFYCLIHKDVQAWGTWK